MIEGLFIGFIVFLWFGGKALILYFEQRDYERKRFLLMVAEELDRLDKITQETKQAERRSLNPSIWDLRN